MGAYLGKEHKMRILQTKTGQKHLDDMAPLTDVVASRITEGHSES